MNNHLSILVVFLFVGVICFSNADTNDLLIVPETINDIGEHAVETDTVPTIVLRRFYQRNEYTNFVWELRATNDQIEDSPVWEPSRGSSPPMQVSDALSLAYPVVCETNTVFELSTISIEKINGLPKWFYLFTWDAIDVSMAEDRPMFLLDTRYTAVLMNGIRLDTTEVKQAESPTMMIPQSDLTRQSITTSEETR